jgi:hypothetical protein
MVMIIVFIKVFMNNLVYHNKIACKFLNKIACIFYLKN